MTASTRAKSGFIEYAAERGWQAKYAEWSDDCLRLFQEGQYPDGERSYVELNIEPMSKVRRSSWPQIIAVAQRLKSDDLEQRRRRPLKRMAERVLRAGALGAYDLVWLEEQGFTCEDVAIEADHDLRIDADKLRKSRRNLKRFRESA